MHEALHDKRWGWVGLHGKKMHEMRMRHVEGSSEFVFARNSKWNWRESWRDHRPPLPVGASEGTGSRGALRAIKDRLLHRL